MRAVGLGVIVALGPFHFFPQARLRIEMLGQVPPMLCSVFVLSLGGIVRHLHIQTPDFTRNLELGVLRAT